MLDERGRILRDNLYGTIEEDVWRRDFTANALYYNIEDFSVWDYVGGVEDARKRVLRLIGDPETRYREDPVRMLRAVRFAAKLGFTIHVDTAAPIPKLAWMLDGVPPARLFDEVNKVFLAGSAYPAFELLEQLQLLEHLFPDLASALQDAQPGSAARELVRLGLQGTDERVRAEKSVTPTFLFAVLMWPAVQRAFAKLAPSRATAIRSCCSRRAIRSLRVSRRASRFRSASRCRCARSSACSRASSDAKGAARCACSNHPRFRAAYDFLLLRAAAGEVDPELAKWWTDIQSASAEERVARVEERWRRRGQRPRIRRPAPAPSSSPPPTARRVVSVAACGCRRTSRSAAISTIRRDRSQPLSTARGCSKVAGSSRARGLYRTAPLGPQDQPEFVNAAAGLLTRARAARAAACAETHRSAAGSRAAGGALGAATHRSRPAAVR